MSNQLSIFTEEQLLLSGLFQQSPISVQSIVENTLADLQLTYGLTLSQAIGLFSVSLVLVGIEQGLIPVAVLVTPPLSPTQWTFPTNQDDFSC